MAWHGMAWHGMAWHGMAWLQRVHGMACTASPGMPRPMLHIAGMAWRAAWRHGHLTGRSRARPGYDAFELSQQACLTAARPQVPNGVVPNQHGTFLYGRWALGWEWLFILLIQRCCMTADCHYCLLAASSALTDAPRCAG